jgi:hypothetical protein
LFVTLFWLDFWTTIPVSIREPSILYMVHISCVTYEFACKTFVKYSAYMCNITWIWKMSYYFPNSFQYAMTLHITTHKFNKNHNLNSFWSCYLQSWDNTWNLIKQDIILSSFCFVQKYTEQVERCQLVLEGLLIFD